MFDCGWFVSNIEAGASYSGFSKTHQGGYLIIVISVSVLRSGLLITPVSVRKWTLELLLEVVRREYRGANLWLSSFVKEYGGSNF